MSKTTEDKVIAQALEILTNRLTNTNTEFFTNEIDSKNFCILKLAQRQSEVFGVLFLTARHQLIEYRELFFGTIDGASVHPREVVRQALELNAAAVIFTHNHPSGNPSPSRADINITQTLTEILNVIGVRTLDHIVVGGTSAASFAELGHL